MNARAERVPSDRVLDVALGLTAFGWSTASMVLDDALPFGVRLCLSMVNAVVGVLFLARSSAARPPALVDFAAALPSILVSALVYGLAARQWPTGTLFVFAAATAFAIVGLLSLGQSFAIFPAHRGLVVRGPYALVRHPIYLGELVMVVVAASSGGLLLALGCCFALLLLLIPRIQREETALASDPDYARYAGRVRYRLIPGIY